MGQKVRLGRDPGRMPKGDFLLSFRKYGPLCMEAGGETSQVGFASYEKVAKVWRLGGRGEQEFSPLLEEGAHWRAAKAGWEVASEGTGGRKGERGGGEDAGSRAWNAG